MDQPNRILIIKLGSIGDVVHTLPALAALKMGFPNAEVDWLVERKARVILERNPLIHELIEVDTHRWRKAWWNFDVIREIYESLSNLRGRSYDIALDFQGLWKSAAFGFFSGAHKVIGFGKGSLREPGCRVLYDCKIDPSPQSIHVVEINQDLVRSLDVICNGYRFDLNVAEEDERYIHDQLSSRQVGDFVILNPGGGWFTKNWDPRNYSRLHDKLQARGGLRSVITWGPGEEILVEEIFRFCETDPPIAFSTTLHQFVSLVRRARLFVGGDTGPLHIAVGCGTPVVGIFGPTSPTRNGPLHPLDLVVSHKVPCGPCYKKTCEIYQKECMQLVTVEEVFEAILQRLKVETDLVVN